jgi:nicotinamide mononucleotide (NMN) deamidase PncC
MQVARNARSRTSGCTGVVRACSTQATLVDTLLTAESRQAPTITPPLQLSSMALNASKLLQQRVNGKRQTLACFEATTGGLVSAALLSVPGASAYYVRSHSNCEEITDTPRYRPPLRQLSGANVYSGPGAKAIFPSDVIEASDMRNKDNYSSRSNYEQSKIRWATAGDRALMLLELLQCAMPMPVMCCTRLTLGIGTVARGMRGKMGATWCVAESGATGPTVLTSKVADSGLPFTAIAVSGPVEKVVLVHSGSRDRELNMWAFALAAVQLLEECVREAAAAAEAGASATPTPTPEEGLSAKL